MEFNKRRSSVQLGENELSYVDIGHGPVALFVHGVFTNSHLWRGVIGSVADDRRCIALDLPAHGESRINGEQRLGLPAQAELLEDFCAALGLDELDLVANDTGGAIVQIFADHHPERLRTLTFTNCDVHDQIPPDAFKQGLEAAAAGELAPRMMGLGRAPERAAESPLALCYEDLSAIPEETVRAFLEPFADEQRAKQLEQIVASLKPEDLIAVEPQLAELEVPTLIVWGTGDVFFDRKWAYWLKDAIAGAYEVVEVPDARLFFPDERPQELVPHLREHWARHAPASAAA